MSGPDFSAQFRSPVSEPVPYMGGTAFGCGDHPTLPKRHRWGVWRVFVMPNPNYIGRDRICRNCALVHDTETKPYKGGPLQW